MTYKDTSGEDNLKFLDQILKICLTKGTNYSITIKTLYQEIDPSLWEFFNESKLSTHILKPIKKIFIKEKNLADMEISTQQAEGTNSDEAKIFNAINYLIGEEYITYEPLEDKIQITFKGIVYVTGGGYYGAYKRQLIKDRLQHSVWIIAIITAAASAIIWAITNLSKILLVII